MPITYSIRVASAESGLSVRWLHRQVKEGNLMALKSGRRLLIRPEDLRSFLERRVAQNSRPVDEELMATTQ